jgi:hypothetical protein
LEIHINAIPKEKPEGMDSAQEILDILYKAVNRRPPWSENIFSIKPPK